MRRAARSPLSRPGMMGVRIPVYVVSGFLGSGKTTLLNRYLSSRDSRDHRLLVLQFESGEEELREEPDHTALCFSREELERAPDQIAERIGGCLHGQPFDWIWVEWNGMAPPSELQELFGHPALRRLCRLERVAFLAEGDALELLLGQTGGAVAAQAALCDLAVIRNAGSDERLRRLKRLLRGLNPGIKVLRAEQETGISDALCCEKFHPVSLFCLSMIWLPALYLLLFRPFFQISKTPLNTLANVFLGILLQAVPFLLIGVLISSAIQIFVPTDAIRRRFPKNLWLGMLTAVLLGFCLPVCDCASVPIFRGLLKKGVPVPAAVTFLTVTPVINPVTMLATYYAFNGNLRVVGVRVGLGILSSVLIGLSFFLRPSGETPLRGGFDTVLCRCGCYDGGTPPGGWRAKGSLFLRHSQAEFFSIGKYLMFGAFFSALFQTLGIGSILPQGRVGYGFGLLFMMILAFFLSLCSSSDAVVARSFQTSLPLGAVMGFLVFGPMMDLKNFWMLSDGFSPKWTARLLVTTFLVCFFVTACLARPLLGG